jgi:DNA-binding FrmR family transcriptional regulator
MSTYHYGDQFGGDKFTGDKFEVRGHGVGKIVHQGPVDQQAAFQDMLGAIRALRTEVAGADRQVIDESLATLQAPQPPEPARLRRTLGAVVGVATMVGQVGAPVIESVRKVMAALGM